MNLVQSCVGLLLIVAGLAMAKTAFKRFILSKESERWPIAKGVIKDVNFLKLRRVGDEMLLCENLVVRYEFEVAGKKFKSDNLAYFNLVYPETTEFAESNPEGSVVDVRYQEADPSNSVILVGSGKKPFSNIVLSLLLIPIGIIVFVMGVSAVK